MSAGIRHFGKPLFVVQMETKEVWGLDRTGKRLEEETGDILCGGIVMVSDGNTVVFQAF